MSVKKMTDRELYRILSLILLVGGAMLLVRTHTRSMGTPYMLEAMLFLLVYGGYLTSRSRLILALPCLPAFVYHVVRLWNFLLMGTWRNLMFFEVALLAVTYLLAALLFWGNDRPRSLRTVVLLLFAVCIGFGVWDLVDGWWVLMNHTWTAVGERLSLFVFYYIPDTLFWILPFFMMGKKILDRA